MTLPAPYVEMGQRLALGIELIDAPLGARVARPVSVAIDGVPVPLPLARSPYRAFGFEVGDVLPRVDRHDSCVHALVYRTGLYRLKHTTVTLRVTCPARRYVPRRLQFRLVDPALPEPPLPDPDQATLEAMRAGRWRRVALFPGAAYDAGSAPTGLRGRVRRGSAPLRWARVEARPALRGGGRGPVIGRAQGDDRGEFLLILGAIPGSALASLTVDVEVSVFAWPADPPATALLKEQDPLWDLPVEPPIAPVDPAVPPPLADAVALGTVVPAEYTAKVVQIVTFKLGKVLSSEIRPFTF